MPVNDSKLLWTAFIYQQGIFDNRETCKVKVTTWV